MIKTDFKFNEVHDLRDQIEYGGERVHFKNIFENSNGGVALIGFKAGQKLDEHVAPAEVMVNVIEGSITFIIGGQRKDMKCGDFLLIGVGIKHAVIAETDAKVMLVKIKND